MKILLLSFYYPPDLCAGSFRAAALVEALREVGRDTATIDVMTTRPNRYASHAATPAAGVETVPGLTIQRFDLPPHQSGIADQMRAYRSYAIGVWRAARGRKWDVVVATSSRLMTAALGAQVAKRAKARFYLDLRDLFTDTASGLFGAMPMRVALPALRWLERTTLKVADRVNVVSPGFLPYLTQFAPTHDYRVFTNGIDEVFLSQEFDKPDAGPSVPRL
ncbi:MAG: glycosyltransferase, partial [Pirellulaceae bacterium]